jgi:hypothetical protein
MLVDESRRMRPVLIEQSITDASSAPENLKVGGSTHLTTT